MKNALHNLFLGGIALSISVSAASPVLQKSLKQDPDNIRYRFYSGQELQDAGHLEKALEHYEKVVELSSKGDEASQAMLQIALIKDQLGSNTQEIIDSFKQAYAFDPEVADSLYYLSLYARKIKQYDLSYEAAKQGIQIQSPDKLHFTKDWIYRYGLLFEYSLSAYHTGHYLDASLANRLILSDPSLTPSIRETVERTQKAIDKKTAHLSNQGQSSAKEALYQAALGQLKIGHPREAYTLAGQGLLRKESQGKVNVKLNNDLLFIYWLAAVQIEQNAQAVIASKLLLVDGAISKKLLEAIRVKLTETSRPIAQEDPKGEIAIADSKHVLEQPKIEKTHPEDEIKSDPSVSAYFMQALHQDPQSKSFSKETSSTPFKDKGSEAETAIIPNHAAPYAESSPAVQNIEYHDMSISENAPAQFLENPPMIELENIELAKCEDDGSTCSPSIYCQSNGIYSRIYGSYHYGRGFGDIGSYATAGDYADLQVGCLQPFLDLQGHFFKGGQWATNAGGGFRCVNQQNRYLFGLNAFYDFRNNHKDFEQIGVGLELSLNFFDISVNGYLPIGKRYYRKQKTFISPLGFEVIERKRYESLCGGDLEIGSSWNRWACCRSALDLYIGGGVYYYNNRKGSSNSFTGGSYIAELSYRDLIIVGLRGTYDKIFKSTLQGYVEISIPFSGFGFACPDTRQECFVNRFSGRPVRRNPIILQSKPSISREERVAAAATE